MNDPVREKLRSIKNFSSLIEYLRDELDWPIESDNFDDLTFDYEPDELGIDENSSSKINVVKQLRPLVTNQPWGIFFIEFEPKRLPVVALRRILRSLVIKQRTSRKQAAHPSWNLHDLLFISNYGEGNDRQITFAHFSEENNGSLPTLRVLGWDDADTALHIDHVHAELKDHMNWPKDDTNIEAWREQWSSVFTLRHREVITTSKALAEKLADLAKRIRKRTNHIMAIETSSGPLRQLHAAFKKALIHDLSEDDFADMYAQTITYGLLTARVSRPAGVTPDTLPAMVPITNPFLKEMLETFLIVGGRKGEIDFDELDIHEVVDLLNNPDTHIEDILRDFGNRTRQEDPVIHFYEFFLKEYDAKKKIKRGVFYTPQPVVSYIVRSVQELLQTEFVLEDGLASTITWGEMVENNPDISIPNGVSPDESFVMILDPAVGTATFLVEVIDVIHTTMKNKWEASGKKGKDIIELWNNYVPNHLLPRLYGYELMMAPYAIAHMKIGLKLHETGYQFGSDARANIYLTNSLEPPSLLAADEAANLFEALGHEAQEVNEIKRDKWFMVVIGNPPYSGESANKGDWIMHLMEDYKKEPGGKQKLQEKNSKWINDDYVKFLRYGQSFIKKNGEGILAFINPHGFLDNPTFRGMRWSLLKTYNKIYTIDLHGNSEKKEISPDGSTDKNVFDIKQGVSINLFIKNGSKKINELSKVFNFNLFGIREKKYNFLLSNSLNTIPFTELIYSEPNYFFVAKDFDLQSHYENFFKLTDLFPKNGAGIVTKRDAIAYQYTKKATKEIIQSISDLSCVEIKQKYPQVSWESRDGKVEFCKNNVVEFGLKEELFVQCNYRPFDYRWTYYTGKSKGFIGWPVHQIMSHFLSKENTGLVTSRQCVNDWRYIFITKLIGEFNLTGTAGRYGSGYYFPLYLYTESNGQQSFEQNNERTPNLNTDIVNQIAKKLDLRFNNEKEETEGTFAPIDILDYIYAVLHSPMYREKYKEFLKIDFPRVPYQEDTETFWRLVELGGELRGLHLLESKKVEEYITEYPNDGDNKLTRKIGKSNWELYDEAATLGRIWINDTQYFKGIPLVAWEFYIGGYQPAQKWLKDRKGRKLSIEEILHYQKIIVALSETDRLMREIDEVIEEHGGWPGAFVTNTKEKI